MTVRLKIGIEAKEFYATILNNSCPYINDGRMIGSIKCLQCDYCKDSDFDNLTIDCSYEYDHLTDEEKMSIEEE